MTRQPAARRRAATKRPEYVQAPVTATVSGDGKPKNLRKLSPGYPDTSRENITVATIEGRKPAVDKSQAQRPCCAGSDATGPAADRRRVNRERKTAETSSRKGRRQG